LPRRQPHIAHHHTATTPHMPSLTIEQPTPPPFAVRLYTPRPRRTTHVDPLDETRHRKADKATRRQKFVAAAQARRSWLATSNRIKAVLRFSSPVPHRFWGGQKLNAVMRFRRSVGRRSVGHISNVSFQHLPGLSTTEESASLPSIPREPSASGPPRSRRLAVPKKDTEAPEELIYELLTEKGMSAVFMRQHDLAKRRSETWNEMAIFSKLKPPKKKSTFVEAQIARSLASPRLTPPRTYRSPRP